MNTNNSKRAAVYAVEFSYLADCRIYNVIGISTISFSGDFKKLDASEIKFSEKKVENGYDVDFSFKITDTSAGQQQKLEKIQANGVVCKLLFSDGTAKLLGVNECPVRFSLSRKDNPSYFMMQYKGKQPEMAKFLPSF